MRFELTATLLLLPSLVSAAVTDLGTIGRTWPVVERDITRELQARAIEEMPSKEEIARKIRTYQPQNLATLRKAQADRSFPVEMSYTLNRDIRDGNGTLLYPKGYRWNPLEYLPLRGGLVVIDGSKEEVAWFQNTPYAENPAVKLLLSGGYAWQLGQQLQRPVFCLTKPLAERLHLKATPSLVVQRGTQLEVREFVIQKRTQHRTGESP